MRYPSIVSVFLAIFANRGIHADTTPDLCPVGPKVTTGPSTSWYYHACTDSTYQFYIHGNYDICCEKQSFSPCEHTGMQSRFLMGVPHKGTVTFTLEKISAENFYKPYIYDVKNGDRRFVCPYPIGYLWYNIYNNPHNIHAIPSSAFLPIDHIDTTTKLNVCTSNKDCTNEQFCGDVINVSYDIDVEGKCELHSDFKCARTTDCPGGIDHDHCDLPQKVVYVDGTHFCYKSPEITGDYAAVSQFALKSSAYNLMFCDNDNDCVTSTDTNRVCHTGLAPNHKWTSYVTNLNLPAKGERKLYSGLCVEAKPIAYVFSHVFETTPQDEKNFLPVDIEQAKFRDLLKTCAKNADCGQGEFCGNIYSLKDVANFDSQHQYCFKAPEVFAANNVKPKCTIVPELVGIVPCDTNADCKAGGTDGNSFCLTETSTQYAKNVNSQRKLYKGLCAEASVCDTSGPNGHFWDVGGLSKTNDCDKNEDCAGGGNTEIGDNAQEVFETTCVKGKTSPGVNLCCYRKAKHCKVGKVVKETIRCGKNTQDPLARDGPFAECYGGLNKLLEQSTRLDTWCDWTIEQCCQDPDAGFCPDRQVPLFNEPTCTDYDETKPDSGTCPTQTGAICKLGHCCSKAEPDGNGNLEKPEYSYVTHQPCTPGVRPKQFPSGYCDPDSKTVVIIGKLSSDGKPLTRSADQKKCVVDADCSADSSKLCIYEEPTATSLAYCYLKPNAALQGVSQIHEEDGFPLTIIVVIILIALIVIVLAVLIGSFIFYKKKLKKNKKAKKGKKNKGKDKKKKNKKEKKAKKTSKTSSSSSGSKSTSITGKTGTGTSTGGYSPSVF